MATPNVKRVQVQLDKKRHLVLDMNALCLAEELTGRNFISEAALSNLSIRDVRALLVAGLRKEDPNITQELIGAWVHAGNLPEVVSALVDAFGNAMPEATQDAERPLVPSAVSMLETVPTS